MADSPETSAFPKRPPHGTKGRAMRPYANFFEFSLPTKPDLFQLDVKFSSPKLPREKRQEVFRQLRIMYPKLKVYYDDTAIAFTDSKFEGGAEIMTEEVALPSGRPDSDPIKVTLKIVSILTYTDLAAFLSGKKEMTPESYSYLNLLNIYAFHFAANDPALVAFGKSRCFFMLNGERVRLQGGLELLFGGFMSVRWGGVDLKMKPSEKLYLNIDTVATTFDTPGPLLDRIKDEFPRINFAQKLARPDYFNLLSFLKKKKVNVTHRGATFKKWYIVTGVTETSAAQTFFEIDGKKVSVAQHFQNAYKINLKFPNFHCVTVKGGPTGRMELPMEVCMIPEGVRHVGFLSGPQTSDIIKKTATKPVERQKKIYDLNRIISNGQARDNSLGVKISDKMVMVDARVIIEPKVRYGEKKIVPPRQGSWNLLGAKFTEPKRLDNWIIMDLKGDNRIAHECVNGFVEHSTARGMTVNPKPHFAQGNPHSNLEPLFKQTAARVQNLQLIMVILPSEHAELYNMVKRICDCILGVPTQCLVFKKLLRADGQYYSNVALKVNHKLGGTNNALAERLPLFDRPTMIVGADVTHPGGMSGNPSIASVVGSINTDANLYVAKIDFQKSRKEFIENFEEMFLQLIRAFYVNNKKVLPERIVYYRDGVGETMFKEVKRLEIAAMIRAFDRVPKPYSANIKDARYRPKVTMIVVQKRHHARFFPESPKDADRSGNCPAGMVVETVITNAGSFDFYLQSQAGLQGTSRPTHYQILHDENAFTSDSLQELTYRMCYLQGRSTRSVSIVPAVYHADIACFRARTHLLNPDWSESSSGRTKELNIDDLRSKLSAKLDNTMWWM